MRLFVPRDLDGFFGLFIDNLVQLMLIIALCQQFCGMSGDDAWLLSKFVLPGAAVSVLFGNVFYAWQAHRLAKRTGRTDVTALPYGINTPSLLVFVWFVMEPTYRATKSATLAWQMGVLACLASGVIEFLGAFVANAIRRASPRAALLSTLSGIAIGFIAMTFALQIWSRPLIAVAPMAIVLCTYAGRLRFPLGVPGGLVALALGTGLGWLLYLFHYPTTVRPELIADAWNQRTWNWPIWCGGAVWEVLRQPTNWLPHLSVIVPMALFNLLGSLQNIESAEAAGDPYDAPSSLAVNGLGSVVAGLFGSCFPTTIYIGHPGWKELGARAGYSTVNGLVIVLLCFSGTVQLVQHIVPIEAGIAIVLWIGIIITAQAFQTTPTEHAPAVATGLFPAIAAWGATVVAGAFIAAGGGGAPDVLANVVKAGGNTMQSCLEAATRGGRPAEVNGYLLHGLIVLERGFIFSCMTLAAMCACLIDRAFFRAAAWAATSALLAATGLIHAYQINGNVVDYLLVGMTPAPGALAYRALDLAAAYLGAAAVLAIVGWRLKHAPSAPAAGH